MVDGLQALTSSNDSCLATLDRLAADLVGSIPIWEVQEHLTRVMLAVALRNTAANYAQCAQLLGVKRQAIQQMVTRYDLAAWVQQLRAMRGKSPFTLDRLITTWPSADPTYSCATTTRSPKPTSALGV
jgi:hypothetical protein